MTELGLAFVAAGTLLFFFWIYGIVSFGRDLRHKFVPALREYLATRRSERTQADSGSREREAIPEEREQRR